LDLKLTRSDSNIPIAIIVEHYMSGNQN
jgi:hypothetical protein